MMAGEMKVRRLMRQSSSLWLLAGPCGFVEDLARWPVCSPTAMISVMSDWKWPAAAGEVEERVAGGDGFIDWLRRSR